MTRPFRVSGSVEALAIVNANPERMVALIYAGDALRHLGSRSDRQARDERYPGLAHRRAWVGWFSETQRTTDVQSTRSLSAIELPWQLHVTDASADGSGITANVETSSCSRSQRSSCWSCWRVTPWPEASFVKRRQDSFSPISSPPFHTSSEAHSRRSGSSPNCLRMDGFTKKAGGAGISACCSRRHRDCINSWRTFWISDAWTPAAASIEFEPLDFSELVQDGIEEYQSACRRTNGHKIEVSFRFTAGSSWTPIAKRSGGSSATCWRTP